jgi:hypothetical protein
VGENPPGGVVVNYWLKSRPQGDVKIEFVDAKGAVVNTYSSRPQPQQQAAAEGVPEENPFFRGGPAPRVTVQPGWNRFTWNMRYPDAASFPGLIMWAAGVTGPVAAPGTYTVRLTVNGKTESQNFELKKDPRLATTPDDYAKQLSLALQVRDKLSETNQGVIRIREVRRQLEEYTKRDDKKVADAAKELSAKLTKVEEELYQTKNRASEDPLNYPIKLNNRVGYILGVVESSDNPPTAQSYKVYEDLATQVNAQLKTLKGLLDTDLAAFNKLVHDQNVPAVK